MSLDDLRRAPAFVVRLSGEAGVGKTALLTSLLDFPVATDEEVARLKLLEGDEEPQHAADAAAFCSGVSGVRTFGGLSPKSPSPST